MRNPIKYAAITLCAFFISFLAIGRMPQLLVIIGLAAAAVYFMSRKIDDKDIRKIAIILFLFTFFLQVVVSLLLYATTVDTKYYGFSYKGDDYIYGDFGTIVGDLWRRGIFPSLKGLVYYNLIGQNAGLQQYQLYNAFIFYLFGACAGQILLIINCFFHAAIIIPVYFILKTFRIRDGITIFVFLLFLFWPSTFYMSLFNFREPILLFSIVAAFGLFMSMDESSLRFPTMLLALTFLFVAYALKSHLVVILPIILLYFWKWRYKKIVILALLLLMIVRQLMPNPPFSNFYVIIENLPETIYGVRHAVRNTNTAYFTNLFIGTYLRLLLYLPIGLLSALILPFILKPLTVLHILMNLESAAWWCLLPFLFGGIWTSIKRERKKTFVILLVSFFWLIVLSLTQANMGTLARQKSLLYYAGFIFIGLGIDRAITGYRDIGKPGNQAKT